MHSQSRRRMASPTSSGMMGDGFIKPKQHFFFQRIPHDKYSSAVPPCTYPKVSNASSEIFHPKFLTPMPFLHSNISNKQSAATLHFQKKVYHYSSPPHSMPQHFFDSCGKQHISNGNFSTNSRIETSLSLSLNNHPSTQNHQNFVHLSYIGHDFTLPSGQV